jgi:two-component system, OmpR family, response regulator
MSMRILLVEDDVRLADIVRRSLTDRGHVVDVVHDGNSAIDMTKSDSYEAVILDVMLPGADGFTVLRSMRANGYTRSVLMLTARDSTQDLITGLDGGADDYLRKPFVFAELEARLRTISRREKRGAPVESLTCGDVAMDLASRRVWRGDREITLTARETAFLEYFLRHPNKLIPRQLLEDALWESDRDSASNLIEVYISRLRRKLCANGEPDVFATIRGVGYRFGEIANA